MPEFHRKCFVILAVLGWSGISVFAQLPEGIFNTQEKGDNPPTPEQSLAAITVPEGFHVSLFAAEPDVAQPIAINFDDKGRLWVAESFSYIEWKRNGKDRILIFEDTDNDGTFDKRTVFWDRGNHLSGFQIGFGGVWVCDAPNLLFIPDADRDDIPDGDPKVILDGWTTEAEHNFFNGLTWGPDGWLYGRHGIKKPSLVGKPGDPPEKRHALSCSIWRYHPVRESFEVYAEGTINPWGLDWNEEGQAFITTSVVDHFWHLIPGARFARWKGQGTSLHPHSYDLMEPASDHRHWQGGETERRQAGEHDQEGGGHSHCGLMIYQSEQWPEEYRGRAFVGNVLGARLNTEHISRRNSGYVASHRPDFLKGNNAWFRATDLKQGPYGEMMLAEWTDFGECHDRDGIHRTSGRIYRVWHGESPEPKSFDVGAVSTEGLLGLLDHENAWWRRHALQNLYERVWNGQTVPEKSKARLIETANHGSIRNAITALHALQAIDAGGDWLEKVFENRPGEANDVVRARVIGLRFLDATPPNDDQIAWLAKQVDREKSAIVHLWMAAALQRIPVEQRWEAAETLAEIKVLSQDRNLILMRWYGIEPLVAGDPSRAIKMALKEGHPYLSRAIARRAVAAKSLSAVLSAVGDQLDSPAVAPILEGLLTALPSQVVMPEEWKKLSSVLRSHSDQTIRQSAYRLAHCFGDPDAEDAMLATVLDAAADSEERRELIGLLIAARSEKLQPHIMNLIGDSAVGTEAIRAVGIFPGPDSAERLIDHFVSETTSKSAVLETLASRPDYAEALVGAFESSRIKREEIPAYVARQVAKVAPNGSAFARSWGLNTSDAQNKDKVLAKWKKRFPEEVLAEANPVEGRKVYQRICGACHKLYGEGGEIGPELTGSNRANLDYFFINVLFPGEDISDGYQLISLKLKDGRVLAGNIASETEQVIVFRQVGQEVKISVDDVESRELAEVSLMPLRLIDHLNRNDVRDLIGYLRSKSPPDE